MTFKVLPHNTETTIFKQCSCLWVLMIFSNTSLIYGIFEIYQGCYNRLKSVIFFPKQSMNDTFMWHFRSHSLKKFQKFFFVYILSRGHRFLIKYWKRYLWKEKLEEDKSGLIIFFKKNVFFSLKKPHVFLIIARLFSLSCGQSLKAEISTFLDNRPMF